ncbi:MAG: nucleotidyltransferase domain-containing protein [Candidatus Bathyarchaeota archaeon]|nr:MAG: nucleotidyltransferase domain-containing protein [Candidatus Bathyarchaeota archaeon]
MATKPKKHANYKEVDYTSRHWALLWEYREKAAQIMAALEGFRLQPVVHGSIARGDVNKNSDIDVFIANLQSSFLVETALEKAKTPINARLLVQATPTYAMKAHIEIDVKTSVSFPLMRMRRVEREFYKFGGEINLNQLREGTRVAGVDKKLMLIEPTGEGHIESSILGREEHVAKILGVSAGTVRDRVRVLLKRDEVGRTGVFIKKELVSDETFEMALKKLADKNPAIRRRMKMKTHG